MTLLYGHVFQINDFSQVSQHIFGVLYSLKSKVCVNHLSLCDFFSSLLLLFIWKINLTFKLWFWLLRELIPLPWIDVQENLFFLEGRGFWHRDRYFCFCAFSAILWSYWIVQEVFPMWQRWNIPDSYSSLKVGMTAFC